MPAGNLQITMLSTNPGAIPNPSPIYTSPNTTGSFTAQALPGTSGQSGRIFLTVTQTNIQNTGCCLYFTTYSFPFTVT